MSFIKSALIGGGLALTAMTGAYALTEGESSFKDRHYMLLAPNGTVQIKNIQGPKHDSVMKMVKPISDQGILIYRSGGKFYMAENTKMADGVMLFDYMSKHTP